MSVAASPWQIFVLPEIFAVGNALEVTVTDVLLEQEPFETVTEYVDVDVITGVMEEVVAPVLHTYEVPPEALSVAELPAQIDCVPLMLAVGSEFSVTFALEVFVQPFAPVTVTV